MLAEIDLATIGGEILRSKRPKIDSHNQVSDGFLFKMYFYKQRRKGIFVAFVVWSVVINNLLICQFREADSRFSRRRSEPHPPWALNPRALPVALRLDQRMRRPASQAGRGAREGRRGGVDASVMGRSIQIAVPNLAFRPTRVLIWTVWFSFLVFFFFLLGESDFKNTDQVRLFYFTFFVLFVFLFPLNQKENPSHKPTPLSFYAKLKMAISYYSHNGIDSVCVWLCVICFLFFF